MRNSSARFREFFLPHVRDGFPANSSSVRWDTKSPSLLDRALSASVMWPPGWACLHPNASFLGLWISHAASHLKGTHPPLKRRSPHSLPDVWCEDSPQFFGFLKITFPGTYLCLESGLRWGPLHTGWRTRVHMELSLSSPPGLTGWGLGRGQEASYELWCSGLEKPIQYLKETA